SSEARSSAVRDSTRACRFKVDARRAPTRRRSSGSDIMDSGVAIRTSDAVATGSGHGNSRATTVAPLTTESPPGYGAIVSVAHYATLFIARTGGRMPRRMARTPTPGRPVRGSKTGRPTVALLDLLGRRWTLRIVWELRETRRTFRALQT